MEGQRAMNREEGSYQLSHAYTTVFLAHQLLTVPRTGRRNDAFIQLLKTSGGSQNVKVLTTFGRN